MNVVATSVAVPVADPDASRRFLSAHLGFREELVTDELVWLTRDDGAADIMLRRCPPAEPPHLPTVVTFTVTGIVAEHARLRQEGAAMSAPLRRWPWGEWSLRLVDPNGLEIELVEWVAPAGA
ncbi:VOC family protein [Actinomadura sp. WMMB 499]|uniref:VOC family protein n=1 Tax=Actinomadura sp. WMMB 499 TaxID=1219491 RepID=UPI00124832D1|nr:VOC family protein [Actinomadura sp. WMMB 499]QFG24544.1 VOC family protein [Actinomadura sp. WMMB 499]